MTKLMDIEQQMQGMTKRSSIYNRLGEVLSEDWMTEEEAKKQIANPDAIDRKRRSIRHV